MAALCLDPIEEFDYAVYLRGSRESPPGSDEARAQAADLLAMFQDFQRASVLDFYTDVHTKLEDRARRNVPFSCNNAEGFLLYLHEVHDFAMFEAYPDKEGIPEFFYRERVLPLRRLGKRFIIFMVARSSDLQFGFGGNSLSGSGGIPRIRNNERRSLSRFPLANTPRADRQDNRKRPKFGQGFREPLSAPTPYASLCETLGHHVATEGNRP